MKTYLILIFCASLAGCNPLSVYKDFFVDRNEKAVFAMLKRVHTAQMAYSMDNETYARAFPDLQMKRGGIVSRDAFRAWDGHDEPVPYRGYFFTDVEEWVDGTPLHELGGPLSSGQQIYGVCAYPSSPGSMTSGNLMFLMLIDNCKSKHRDDDYQFWMIKYDNIGHPVKKWPSEEEFAGYTRFKFLTPGQGFKKAKALKKRYDDGELTPEDIKMKSLDGKDVNVQGFGE